MTNRDADSEHVLRWPLARQPRWLRTASRVLLAVTVVRAVWVAVEYAATGEGLGRMIWALILVLVFALSEVSGLYPMEVRATREALVTPRFFWPRHHHWDDVREIRERKVGRWTQGLIAELTDGKEVPVYPVEIGDAAALDTPEVTRFLEAARERIASSG